MKGISVIVPTLNRTDFLLKTLQDLVEQKFELLFEILVIDQSSSIDKKSKNFCKKYDYIKYEHITFFKGLPEARNYGASKSKYDLLLFLDDDIECGANLLQEHYNTLKKPNVGVVAGGITEKFKENRDTKIGFFNKWIAQPLRGFHQKAAKEVDHAGGGNFSVKKSIYNLVGGVDEYLTVGAALYEETDFCLRVKQHGAIIYYNYEAHVYHLAAKTGGCRVDEIDRYIFSLSRNKTIIIHRYLAVFYMISAKAYLLRLVMSYAYAYKSKAVFKAYIKGVREGKRVANKKVKRTYFE